MPAGFSAAANIRANEFSISEEGMPDVIPSPRLREYQVSIVLLSILQSKIEIFHFFPGPGRPSQKRQGGLDTRIICKATDRDPSSQFFPAKLFHKTRYDHFQRDPMQGISRVFSRHKDPLHRQGREVQHAKDTPRGRPRSSWSRQGGAWAATETPSLP